MSIASVTCRAQLGLSAPLVQVEVSLGSGLPIFNIVGLPATVVKESKDRVRAALVNSNFEFPAGRIVVNLSPADIPKHGGRFDLPIALGILLASGQIKLPAASRHDPQSPSSEDPHFPRATVRIGGEFYGELGLSGELKSVPGILLAAAHAARDGHEILVPRSNADEVSILAATTTAVPTQARLIARAADHLSAVCAHLDGTIPLPTLQPSPLQVIRFRPDPTLDLRDVHGQLQAKRALIIAAAGGHSLLMMGPPGAGKSMLAMRLPSLLPAMTESEALEVAAIASVSGTGFNARNFGRRPVRIPHHTASAVALIGGGSHARPGEISLAHHGVLFLDELLEYDRRALEALREPLESGVVCIARAAAQAQYPAEFQLIAAMNPCPCGRHGDPLGNCACTPAEVARYRARVSAPLMERFDIHLEVPRVDLSDFDEKMIPAETSEAASARVTRCSLDQAARTILERAMKHLGLSARARQRILKLARTIADMNGDATVTAAPVSEAVSYRAFDRRQEIAGSQPDDIKVRGPSQARPRK
jgi:magnesium chelatase family protein